MPNTANPLTGGLPAKLSRPVLPPVLERERLLNVITRAPDRSMIWICGPSGGGKTTLVANYLEGRDRRHIWYTLEPEDADAGSFFHFLSVAAARLDLRCRSLPKPTEAVEKDPIPFARVYFERLGECSGDSPVVLVFDDVQTVQGRSLVPAILSEAVRQLSSGMKIICLSRESPPPVMAPLRASRIVSVVEWDELRLDDEETRKLVELRESDREEKISRDRVDLIARQTRGWPAGVILMTEAMRETDTNAAPLLEPKQAVFEYFAEELFRKFDGRMQGFLINISVLPRMTVNLAIELTGESESGAFLDGLYRGHAFIERRAGNEWVYQLHPLFRAFLRSRLEEVASREELDDLRRRAAALLQSAGWTEEAVVLFADSGSHDDVRETVIEEAPRLVGAGRIALLEDWLRRLPEKMRNEYHELCYWAAVCRLGPAPSDAGVLFWKSIQLSRQAGDRIAELRAWCGAVDATILAWKNFEDLDPLIDEFPGLPESEIDPALERKIAAAKLAALLHRRPQADEMKPWVDRVRELMDAPGPADARLEDGCRLLQYAIWIPDHSLGESLLARFGDLASDPGVNPLSRLVWRMLAIAHRWLRADFEKALREMEQTLELARRSGVGLLDHQITGMGVYATLCEEDIESSEPLLVRLDPSDMTLRPLDLSHHQYLHAWGLLVKGDLAEALWRGREALELTLRVGAPFPAALNQLLLAQVHLERREFEEAKDYIDRTFVTARQMDSALLQMASHLQAAHCAGARGDHRDAREHLRAGFAAGREADVVNYAGWRSRWMADRCGEALAEGIETQYVTSLIRRRHLPAPSDAGAEDWPWPFRITTFGGLGIDIDGGQVHFASKVPRRALDLLSAIVALGGIHVAERTIADLLWPDAEGDAALQSLATTLHRLRRVLGDREVIHRAGGMLAIDRERCWCDLWEIEALLDRGSGESEKDETERIDRLLRLYRGSFLSETEETWVLPRRRQLREQILARLILRGEGLESDVRYAEAIELYLRGLTADPVAEPLVQGLLRCYRSQGRRSAMIAAFRDFERLLESTLDTGPAEATRKLLD